jgi:hypothetical protein
MFNNTTPPAPLTPDFTGSSETFEKVPSYDIAPEDQELANSIANFDHNNVPSPIEAEGDFRVPERFTARALPDGLRQEVERQLVGLPAGEARDSKEHELTMQALRKNSLGVRVRLGLGAGANKFQRETFAIQRDVEQLEAEATGILNSLAEVVSYEVTGTDPVTGEQKTKPTYRINGDRRRGMELRHAELTRHLAALDGIEGDRRLKRALFEAVADEKQARAQVSRMTQAREMAAEMLEREEVEKLAKGFAANRRNHLG